MIEQFISKTFHPNRAVELLSAISLMDKLGLSGYLYRLNEIVDSEQGTEASVIAFNLDNLIGVGLTDALSNFGVTIEYPPNEISLVIDLLQFLAFWDTAEGFNPATLEGVEDLSELGATPEDILIELFELAGCNPDCRMIDWVMRVSPTLIARIGESIVRCTASQVTPQEIPADMVSQLKVLAAHYPNSRMVDWIRAGGAINISVSTLILENEERLAGLGDKELAAELAAIAIVSNLPRENLAQRFIELIEPTVGTTLKGQTVIREINAVFAKVLAK